MKILFITANRVGDAVLTTGILKALVDQHPDASFTIACGPYGADLFRAVPHLEKLIVMTKKKWNGHWVDLWKQTIGTHWDLVVDMRNSVVSRLLRAQQRAIHKGSTGSHKVIENGAVLSLSPPPDPFIWTTPEAEKAANRMVPTNAPLLALGPAANWPLKQWPIAYFIDFVKKITAPDGALPSANVMIIADKHERAQIEPLLKSIPDARRIELIGGDLQTVAAALKKARLYVGNDSGLMHLSAALGTPTLGLFGPGFPDIYGPWGKNCAYVRTPETREQLLAKVIRDSPQPETLMDTLGVESVLRAATDLLSRTAS